MSWKALLAAALIIAVAAMAVALPELDGIASQDDVRMAPPPDGSAPPEFDGRQPDSMGFDGRGPGPGDMFGIMSDMPMPGKPRPGSDPGPRPVVVLDVEGGTPQKPRERIEFYMGVYDAKSGMESLGYDVFVLDPALMKSDDALSGMIHSIMADYVVSDVDRSKATVLKLEKPLFPVHDRVFLELLLSCSDGSDKELEDLIMDMLACCGDFGDCCSVSVSRMNLCVLMLSEKEEHGSEDDSDPFFENAEFEITSFEETFVRARLFDGGTFFC